MGGSFFHGIHNFGGLPIVDHALAADEVLEKPRSTIEETVTFVVRLLDEAIAEPELPWNIPTSRKILGQDVLPKKTRCCSRLMKDYLTLQKC